MKTIFNAISIAGLLLVLFFPCEVQAQNFAAVHWVNESGQNAATVLNANGIFTTDFKANNDVTVTLINVGSTSLYTDIFGGASPGNNPGYITNFTGVVTNGTGDGIAGDIEDLEMTYSATGTLQFDFATPLTPQDRILLVDVDFTEQYLVQAYAFNGSSYVQVSLAGWNYQNFSGTTGITPDSTWPVWNPATGTLTSGSSVNLNEELSVLTPNQNIDRLVISKQSGTGFSTDITFLSLKTPLTIRQSGSNMVLNWTNSAFNLQSAPAVTGTYTNVPGATSPYTNAITGSQKFFRLIAN